MNNLHPTFQNIMDSFSHAQKVAIDLSKPQYPIFYRGYTIEEDAGWLGYESGPAPLHFYPTAEGIQDDADCDDGETFRYCGNRKWTDSIEEAKAEIDCIIAKNTTYAVKNLLTGKVEEFHSFIEAIKCAIALGPKADYHFNLDAN